MVTTWRYRVAATGSGGGSFVLLSEIWKLPRLPAEGCGHCLIGVDSEDPDHACTGPLPRIEIEALIK
jgi:hypothetical protein